jgi:hypothetical protein
MTNKNELLPVTECSALCGSKAQGSLKEEISLPIYYTCRNKIDPGHQWIFVRFIGVNDCISALKYYL